MLFIAKMLNYFTKTEAKHVWFWKIKVGGWTITMMQTRIIGVWNKNNSTSTCTCIYCTYDWHDHLQCFVSILTSHTSLLQSLITDVFVFVTLSTPLHLFFKINCRLKHNSVKMSGHVSLRGLTCPPLIFSRGSCALHPNLSRKSLEVRRPPLLECWPRSTEFDHIQPIRAGAGERYAYVM